MQVLYTDNNSDISVMAGNQDFLKIPPFGIRVHIYLAVRIIVWLMLYHSLSFSTNLHMCMYVSYARMDIYIYMDIHIHILMYTYEYTDLCTDQFNLCSTVCYESHKGQLIGKDCQSNSSWWRRTSAVVCDAKGGQHKVGSIFLINAYVKLLLHSSILQNAGMG